MRYQAVDHGGSANYSAFVGVDQRICQQITSDPHMTVVVNLYIGDIEANAPRHAPRHIGNVKKKQRIGTNGGAGNRAFLIAIYLK